MRAYEGLFLVDDGRATENFQAVADHVKALLQRHEAAIDKFEKWDSRRLAYEVKGSKRGTYILTKFKADPAHITALKRDCQISPIILRTMIILEEHVGTVLEGFDELDRPSPRTEAPPATAPQPGPAAEPTSPAGPAAGGQRTEPEPSTNEP